MDSLLWIGNSCTMRSLEEHSAVSGFLSANFSSRFIRLFPRIVILGFLVATVGIFADPAHEAWKSVVYFFVGGSFWAFIFNAIFLISEFVYITIKRR